MGPIRNRLCCVLSLKLLGSTLLCAQVYRTAIRGTVTDQQGHRIPQCRVRATETAGRGRMDREHKVHGQAIKDIYVYPLSPAARQRLNGNLTR